MLLPSKINEHTYIHNHFDYDNTEKLLTIFTLYYFNLLYFKYSTLTNTCAHTDLHNTSNTLPFTQSRRNTHLHKHASALIHIWTLTHLSPTTYNLTLIICKSGSDEEWLAICHTGLLVQMPVSHIVLKLLNQLILRCKLRLFID
jgi:hypothetical protein